MLVKIFIMKKNEILDKLEPIFLSSSFKETSISKIADELWIKKASLYYYFPSKNDLFIWILERSNDKYMSFLDNMSWKNLDDFISDFVLYPYDTSNLIAIIDESYCDIAEIKQYIESYKEKINVKILSLISENFWFKEEKSFLLLLILENLSRKNCFSKWCIVEPKKVIEEIKIMFN